ncbi:Receptor y region, transmembrane domain- and RING domain-containing protein 3 [Grifola frondosa]|uniref:RING-type E3 ubiquitin transferase n=1 Tax=Grifola frondosa TaxID=5627 RepID=A0A1C7M4T2_GRIFR|nr:Receptor y region, transmembrane domain- and RING domain-containing protein 3 [Grifola frondosa]
MNLRREGDPRVIARRWESLALVQSQQAKDSGHRSHRGRERPSMVPRALYMLCRHRRPSALLILSMIHLLVVLALSSYISQVQSHPVEWLRKVSSTAREDGSWLWGWAWASDGSVSVVDRSPPVTFPARPASFGAELIDPLLGYVIPLSAFTAACPLDPNNTSPYPFDADPVQGCPNLCISGPHQPEVKETWIALVQRGGCPFVEKARQAQKLGAKAVVVGGDRDNPDALLNMYSERDASDIKIAATYIKYWDYVELSALIAASNTSHSGLRTLSLLISTEYSAWEWYSPIITFVVILLLPSLLTFITLLIHRVRAARAAQRDRAPESVVHNFPWRIWTGTGWEKHEPTCPTSEHSEHPSSEQEPDLERGIPQTSSPFASTSHDSELPAWVEQQLECAICLELFVKGDRVRVLPCNHMFHVDEIDEWLIHRKKLCPVCKADVTHPHPLVTHPHPDAPITSMSSLPPTSILHPHHQPSLLHRYLPLNGHLFSSMIANPSPPHLHSTYLSPRPHAIYPSPILIT